MSISTLLSFYFLLKDRKHLSGMKKISVFFELYEFISIAVLIFMTCAYYSPFLRSFTSWGSAAALFFVIGMDFYLTVFTGDEEIEAGELEIGRTGYEIAKCLALIYTAPAYIISGLLALDILLKR